MLILPLLLAFPPPDVHREALAHYGYARWLSGRNQHVSASHQLEAAQKLEPSAAAPKRDLVRLYAQLGRDAAAMRLAKDILAVEPTDVATALVLARCYEATAQHRDAANVLAKALPGATEPNQKQKVLRSLSLDLYLAKDWPAAEEGYRKYQALIIDDRKALLADGYEDGNLQSELAQILERIGMIQIERQHYEKALESFQQASAVCKKNNDEYGMMRMHFHRSNTYAAMNDNMSAIAALEKYLDWGPLRVDHWQRYAELMRRTETTQGVEAKLEHYIQIQPSNHIIPWVRVAEMARRDFPSAHVRFQESSSASKSAELIALMVKTYAEHERAAELLSLADELFPTNSNNKNADRQQAFMESLGAHPKFTPSILQAARDGRPHSPQLWESLGWLAERADAGDELERALKQSLRQAGNDPSATAFDRLATYYTRQRKWEELLTLCDSLRDFEAYRAILRSEALAELNRGDEAIEGLQKSRNFANFASRRQLAHIYGILGRHAEMLKELDAMLDEFKDAKDIARIRYLRAEALSGLKRFDDSEAELRLILEADPDDALALNNLGYNLAEQNRKLKEAEELIRYAIEIDRRERLKLGDGRLDNAAYLDSLGWVLFRRGDLKQARVELEKASQLPDGRSDGVVWDHLGDVCFRLGDKACAKAAWQQAAKKLQRDHRGTLGGRRDALQKKLKLV